MRRESSDRDNDSTVTTWEDKWYYSTDVMFSAVAMTNESGSLVERVRYTPYGQARHSWKDDVDGDGDADSADQSAMTASFNKSIGETGYNADADVNRSGKVTLQDTLPFSAKSALAAGSISDYGAGKPDSSIGYDGYVFNVEGMNYTVRHRSYVPLHGRWAERDPLEYHDSSALYQYSMGSPQIIADPTGLSSSCECQGGRPPEADLFFGNSSGDSPSSPIISRNVAFKFYGNHCGPSYGDSPPNRPNDGGGDPINGTDACCRIHDHLWAQHNGDNDYAWCNKPYGQQIADCNVCRCLKQRVSQGGLSFTEWLKNVIMQAVFCNNNDDANRDGCGL